ncbi:MAG: ferredoxin reductase [Saprospiraceae bacterium]|nr:ferredoxin reductase [Saprospiraceae bacterium]
MRFRKDWNKATVVATKIVAQNVIEIELLPANGAIPFSVGSHIDVQVYVNQKPEIRSYSLVGELNDNDTYKIAVKKIPNSRGGSAYIWQLSPDDVLTISQPNNHFELNLFQKKYLLIAGGIGITPMLGMAQVLAKRNADFSFLYLGNEANEMPFVEDLQALNLKNLEIFESNQNGIYDFEKPIGNLDPTTQVCICVKPGRYDAGSTKKLD